MIYEDFITFHRNNPGVFRLFSRFAVEAANTGLKSFSAKTVLQRGKYEMAVEIRQGNDDLNIRIEFAPYYARMFNGAFPEHEGFFITRRVKNNEP